LVSIAIFFYSFFSVGLVLGCFFVSEFELGLVHVLKRLERFGKAGFSGVWLEKAACVLVQVGGGPAGI
jgi:hypothetical protein